MSGNLTIKEILAGIKRDTQESRFEYSLRITQLAEKMIELEEKLEFTQNVLVEQEKTLTQILRRLHSNSSHGEDEPNPLNLSR